MKNNKRVSVIIVNWNGKKWLKRCLGSLMMQTYKNIEVIVVDNASIDKSVDYIQGNFSKIKIIKNRKNLGYPRAVNIGIREARGEYLLLVNNDTWVKRDFVEMLVKFYLNNSYSVISPVVREYDGKKGIINLPNIDPTGSPAYFFPISRQDKLLYLSSSYFCTKKVYMNTLGFDDNYFAYYEDVDWFWRLTLLKKRFGYAENIFIYHEGAGSTGKGIRYKMFLWRNQNALQTLIKNYSFMSLWIILPIYIIQNMFEMIFFLLILKPKISFSYIAGWWFNLVHIRRILKKRAWIQKRRKVNDFVVLKKMYWGIAKFKMLVDTIQ